MGFWIRAGLALVALGFAFAVSAETYWLDSRLDANFPHYRTAEEACVTGELKRRTNGYRAADTNGFVRYRFRSINVGPEQGLGERICRGVIERTYASFWVTLETVDTLIYGSQGGPDTCNVAGYSDADTGQCGPPKCTGECCGDCGGPFGGGGSGSGGNGSNGSNPIHTASGNKYQREKDFVGVGAFPLRFERTYSSNRTGANNAVPLGMGWSHFYLRSVVAFPSISGGDIDRAVLYRHDGRILKFSRSGSTWTPDPDVTEKLAWQEAALVALGWTVTTSNDEIEQYDAEGRLTSITTRDGFTQTLSYNDGSGHPRDDVQSITDAEGRTLTFGYTSGQLTSVTDGAGQVFSYGYTSGNLTSASYPDESGTPKTRTYFYNESGQTGGASLLHALTGIQDENTQRYASWGYTAAGRANLSVHGPFAGGTIDRTSFLFNANGTTTITDALNQARVYGFDVKFGVARLGALDVPCDYCGHHTKAETYDANGYPDLVTDFRNFQTNYDYDSRGLETQRVEAISQPEQRTIGTTWDSTFRVPLTITELGRTTTFTLNGRGQILTKTFTDTRSPTPPGGNEAPRTWTYTYCDAVNLTPPDPIGAGENLQKGCPLVGLLRRIDGPRTDVADRLTYEYRLADDAANPKTFRLGDLWKTTNALSHVTEVVSRDGVGRVKRQKDANGVLTDMTYHPRGWIASRTVRANADGSISVNDATTQFAYDEVGNLTRLTQPDGVYLDYHYDNAHRLDRITDNLGNYVEYTLDAMGHRTAEKTFDVADNVTPKRLLTRTYNALARLEKQYPVDPQALNRYFLFGYDDNGNRIDQTDTLGVKTHWTFDGLNRLKTTVADYQGSDPSTANATTTSAYDARDNLSGITDPNLLGTGYDVDGQNNLDALTSPDTGATGYTQDAAGNRVSQIDARGISTTYGYDALNRLTSVSYPTTSLNTAYFYDEPNATTGCTTSYAVGRLTRITDASGSTTYCYDQRGNVTKKNQAAVGYRFITGYSYNLADRVMGITYPSGAQLTYTRDADGRIQTATITPSGGSATAIITNQTYLPFGPPLVTTFASGGQSQTRTYDQNYWLTDVTGNALNLHFRRDAMGNIDRYGATAGATPPVEQYPYDALYRLKQVQDGVGSLIEGYTYNLTGDRLTKSHPPAATQAYTYTPNTHRLDGVAGNARTLDANGNNTQTTGTATLDFAYDDRNRLTQVKRNNVVVANYAYNGKGERTQKAATFPSTDTRWFSYAEGAQLLGEYTATTAREYVWIDDMPVAILDSTGIALTPADRIFANGFELPAVPTATVSYLHTDHLNTPRAVSSTAGITIWRWDWTNNSFGEAAPNQDPDGNSQTFVLNLRFPGQFFDAETGLHYNYFRDYEPPTGRYPQSDPIGLKGGPSTYLYVLASPLTHTDAKGLQTTVDTWCRQNPEACAAILIGGGALTAPKPHTDTQANCRDKDPDCNEHFSRCLQTKLADAVGGSYGSSRCSLCKDSCVQNGGSWPALSHTGDRCDYWNF